MSDYESQVLGVAPDWGNAQELSMQMEHIEKKLHKMKKQKKGKKGKGRKKLKKRLRAMELRYQALEQYVFFAMCQNQLQASTPKKAKKGKKGKKTKKEERLWWQEAMTNSFPKALELATVSMSRLPPKSQASLALPEARSRN